MIKLIVKKDMNDIFVYGVKYILNQRTVSSNENDVVFCKMDKTCLVKLYIFK